MSKGAHNSSTLLSCQCKQTVVFNHIFVLAHSQISIFAGIIHLFFTLHLELWSNGGHRLRDVRTIREFSSDAESPCRKNEHEDRSLHHVDHSINKVCVGGDAHCKCSRRAVSCHQQVHDQRFDPNFDSDQHGGCGLDPTVLRIRGGAYMIVSKQHSYNLLPCVFYLKNFKN